MTLNGPINMRQSKLSRPILLYRCFVTTLNYWFKGSVFEKWRRVYRLTSKNVWWWFLLILLLFFLIRELLLYAFIPALLRGFLKMKTTFSYFQRMFENPVPAVKTSCKRNINFNNLEYYEISTLYECVEKNRWL